jgi:hypothetical protein
MTNNQFKYAQLNQARNELAEQRRHSKALEAVEAGKLMETVRHQTVQEAIDRSRADEAYRHDLAMESLQKQSNEIAQYDALSKRITSTAGATKSLAETKQVKQSTALAPEYFTLSKQETQSKVRKSNSDIFVNEKNAETKSYEADTNRLRLMKDTVVDAGNFVLNAVNTASGSIGKLVSLLG